MAREQAQIPVKATVPEEKTDIPPGIEPRSPSCPRAQRVKRQGEVMRGPAGPPTLDTEGHLVNFIHSRDAIIDTVEVMQLLDRWQP